MIQRRLRQFFAHEAAAGIVMLTAAALAMLCANNAFAPHYAAFIAAPVFGHFDVAATIADILMPFFFLKVGLELKEEMHGGALATHAQRILPLIAAIGGIIAPALIYLAFTASEPSLQHGWAIPTATDIAFAICIVNLAGKRVPQAAKIFLLAIAIYDDIAAILIIAFFYSTGFAWMPALGALATGAVIALLSRHKHGALPVLLLAILLGFLLHEAGIHTTVAGLIAGLCIPTRSIAPLIARIDPLVAFLVLPLFAFVSAGVNLTGISATDLLGPLPLGIALGLFLGKQFGIFAATVAAVKLGLAPLPKNTSYRTLYAIALIAGIGFTMSLFIGRLAFTGDTAHHLIILGVLAGSALSAVAGLACFFIGGNGGSRKS